jgi:rhamnose utilization protein RhaD (predicted bifunctional aldolase and dehydrogenase)
MDEKGVEAFRIVQAHHMERESYREMVRMVSDAATRNARRLRIDAVHFLALNFEAMVVEPMAARVSSTDAAILDPDIRSAIAHDLDEILRNLETDEEPGAGAALTPKSTDPLEPGGASAGRVLESAGASYGGFRTASWRLWGD